jgi:Cu(I)/Ag(I) efflux system membrane fusion protein
MNIKETIKTKPVLALIVLGLLAMVIGTATIQIFSSHEEADHAGHEEHGVYACPMLCVPPTDKPGDCPVCGMALERIDGASAEDMDRPVIAMSQRSRTLSKVETATVMRKNAAAEVRLTGKVVVDETRLSRIAARVAGRIDDISADFTGKTIKKGDPLIKLYSPDLLSAQEELIQAKNSGKETLVAAREKLRLLGISGKQIQEIEKSGLAKDHMTFFSPSAGVIIDKNAIEGSYVKEGTTLYTIANLAQIWVVLDAYEADIGFIRLDQAVSFTAHAIPGKTFDATVSFIDPILNDMTRAVKVRLDVPNEDLMLKPGMFVHATVKAPLNSSGRPVMADAKEDELPLVVPASAPLQTGKRAVVYVETQTEGEYEGKEVVLGPRVGDDYIVLKGLTEGDRVVVKGNFRIDSAMQIMGKPSMMLPAEASSADEVTEVVATEHPQTKCPIMGSDINKDIYADHDGYRVYFCCPGCDGPFKKDADAIIKKMQAEGIVLDKTPTE